MVDWQEKDGDDRCRVRMDFKIEELQAEEDSRMVHFRIVPDPRRYVRQEAGGKVVYLDKYLDHAIDEREMMRSCGALAPGMPIHHLPASIRSAPDYAAARKQALKAELLDGGYRPPDEEAAQHRPLKTDTKWLVFLSVDICGATALRRGNPTGFEQAYAIFLRELGTVVGQFGGTILKTTGDGFIAYIDHPAFTQQCDKAIDMGLTLQVVIRDSINPSLTEAGLPEIRIRIGGDCGTAQVRSLCVPPTGFATPEVASDALNRVVKIEESAGSGEFHIGRNLYELIHVQWLERAEEVSFDGESVGMPGYKTYRMS